MLGLGVRFPTDVDALSSGEGSVDIRPFAGAEERRLVQQKLLEQHILLDVGPFCTTPLRHGKTCRLAALA